jgi:hypothetical protein
MTRHRSRTATFLGSAIALAVASAAFASTAFAGPAWKFNGASLSGLERIQGSSTNSAFTLPGITTSCKGFLYSMDIENSGGTGKGEIDYLPVFKCATDTACSVAAVTVYNLPWPTNLVTVSLSNYVVIKGVEIGFLYAGATCALDGFEVVVEGTAGGLYNNVTETIAFSKATFTATGTKLSAFGTTVEWNAVFSAEAFGPHLGEALTVS